MATGTAALCTSDSVTLPSATRPNSPVDDDPTTTKSAPCRSTNSINPVGIDVDSWTITDTSWPPAASTTFWSDALAWAAT